MVPMPIGIMSFVAAFGFELDVPRKTWPAGWTAGSTSQVAGWSFCDANDPARTDTPQPGESSPRLGHPDRPRATPYDMSASVPAGFVNHIHDGEFNGGTYPIRCNGNSSNPIWIEGNAAKPATLRFRKTIHFGALGTASYIIFDGIDSDFKVVSGVGRGSYVDVRPTAGATCHHILIRNCEFSGDVTAAVGSYGAVAIGNGTDGPFSTEFICVYNCHIHSIGNLSINETAGIYNAGRTRYIWVLYNTVHHVGSDGIAGTHGANETTLRTEYYFIGGNTLYQNGENSIDLKSIRYGVISQNHMYGPYTRENCWAISLHSSSAPVPVRDTWVIFNHVHRVASGMVTTSSNGARNVHTAGNLFHDIRVQHALELAPTNPDIDPYNAGCIRHQLALGDSFNVENTMYDYDRGMSFSSVSAANGSNVRATGNIMHNRYPGASSTVGYDVHVESGNDTSLITADYNFYPSNSRILWGAAGTRTLAQLQALGQESHALIGDPVFLDAPNGNFALSDLSPAAFANVRSAAYDAFFALFGVAIDVDITGAARPATGARRMGCYEFEAAPPETAPEFTTQPLSQTVDVGATVQFISLATGNPSPSYQWFKDDVLRVGAIQATLSLSNVQVGDAGNYTCVATNEEGSDVSAVATLAINPPPTPPPATARCRFARAPRYSGIVPIS
jgi:hypothetical protein